MDRVGYAALRGQSRTAPADTLPGTVEAFTGMGAPFPGLTAPLIAFIELLGGAALVAGLFTRIAAPLLADCANHPDGPHRPHPGVREDARDGQQRRHAARVVGDAGGEDLAADRARHQVRIHRTEPFLMGRVTAFPQSRRST